MCEWGVSVSESDITSQKGVCVEAAEEGVYCVCPVGLMRVIQNCVTQCSLWCRRDECTVSTTD